MNWWMTLADEIVTRWRNERNKGDALWRTVSFTVELSQSLYELLDWDKGTTAHYSWMPFRQTELLGFGAAVTVTANGRDETGHVKHRFASWNLPPEAATWLGGFAFDPTVPTTGIWTDWPHALWFVPNLLLRRKASSNEVDVIYLDKAETSSAQVAQALASFVQPTDGAQGLQSVIGTEHTRESWEQMIQSAVDTIRTGSLRKVALARQAGHRVTRSLPEALRYLVNTYPYNYVFAMRFLGRWFIGASPEQLVRAQQGQMYVDCLAGSIARGQTDEEDARLGGKLLHSEKNLEEHKAVVRFITDRLKLVATEIEYPDAPELKKLANVQHLYTPVRARLLPNHHVLDVANLLHPTPAVGGVPRAEALSFIREHEGWPRGFYAGGIGVIFGDEDALIHVGLRSALVIEKTAYSFAGCGIVRGSDPAEEWLESELKLMPMRRAFGGKEE